MASISILSGNTNLWIAQAIARNNNRARVAESGGFITITAPQLDIERDTVEQAAGKSISESVWQSFTINVRGNVTEANNTRILIQ